MGKTVSWALLVLLLLVALPLAFKPQAARAEQGTVYIRADGSIDPSTAPISTIDNVTYTFTGDINESIVVERDNTVIDGAEHAVRGQAANPSSGIDLSGRTNVTVENTRIVSFSYGILLSSSINDSICGNDITANEVSGIFIDSSSVNNSISGNNLTGNWFGIYLGSSSNSISGNNITSSDFFGILLDFSFNNSIKGNTLIDCGLCVVNSYENCVEDNTVNGKPLVYFEGVADRSVGDAGQVVLVRCDRIGVEDLNIFRASVGVQLWETNNSIVSGNNITGSNWFGIYLGSSSKNNTVTGNNVANAQCGIVLDVSSGNIVHHNNFVNNAHQAICFNCANAWDDGYPSGGNYWSDYDGSDLYSGPFQNQVGSDGIGDAPYVIDANNTDSYPLMKPYPWDSNDLGVTYVGEVWEWRDQYTICPLKTVMGLGYILNISVFVMNYGSYPEVFNATVYANATVIGEIENVALAGRNFTILSLKGDTTGLAYGNYTIGAYVTPVPGETDTTDNSYTSDTLLLGIPGDVNGDGTVSILDAILLGIHFLETPSGSGWSHGGANADINCDNVVNILDAIVLGNHFFQHYS